jgi:nitronate monooxygenase
MKSKGITWLATVTTVGEAKAAESAGADVVVAQGMEAGGQSPPAHEKPNADT